MPKQKSVVKDKIKRDDFSFQTKELLAKRVGVKCSNPNCRKPTSGPSTDPIKAINTGVAAHITAASPGGPRYDHTLTSEERKSPDNGIWCCQTCGKLVDSDETGYTVELLKTFKRLSEEAAKLELQKAPSIPISVYQSDAELIRFYAQCFDRRAFRDPFVQEGSLSDFDIAIENTITALSTGCLRASDGQIIGQAKGKAFIQNSDWREKLDTVVDLLRAIRSRIELGKHHNAIHFRDGWHCINDRHTAEWMDNTRFEIIRIFNSVAKDSGMNVPLRSVFDDRDGL